jgi:hypothetical protein
LSPFQGWSFVQSKRNKYAFYIYAKDTNAKTVSLARSLATFFQLLFPFQNDNGASYLNKGIGMVITFTDKFPASPPSVYLIGVDHPHVSASAITDMNNGGHYCTYRFNSSVWDTNICTGEAFADTVVNGILDLDNKAPNWGSPYPHHSQAKWTRAACLAKSVAAPTLPSSFT